MPADDRSHSSLESEEADHTECVVAGAVVQDRVVLRKHLFGVPERPETYALMLDVRDVTHVDRNATASLIAANHFATRWAVD